ncbi:MAG TPA: hypothetical protein DIC52_21890 [Candidatus Latescibacteria bacterium]|nr:hypothetical protein [Candidatus Latescibacterota bacterium]
MGLPLSALPARSESFVLVDRSYRHSGWSRLYSTWDFATRIPTNRDAPKDWEQPVDFKNGTYQFRVEVLKMGELGENAQISFGWINSGSDPQIKHTTGDTMLFAQPGIYETSNRIQKLAIYRGTTTSSRPHGTGTVHTPPTRSTPSSIPRATQPSQDFLSASM